MLAPSITMCLAVQQDIIREIGGNQRFRGRGLLARFLFLLSKSQVGYRIRQCKTLSDNLISQYYGHVVNLMNLPLETNVIKLSPDAQALWDEFYNDIEKDLRIGNQMEALKDWGSKLPGTVARIAGLLHYAENGYAAKEMDISVNIVNAAAIIGSYYREHALAIFGLMKEDPKMEAAKKINEYIALYKQETFKDRDLIRHKNYFKTTEDIRPGIEVLIEHGYIRVRNIEKSGKKGRPESISYEVNPEILNH